MGKLHHILSPAELKKLDNQKKKDLQKQIAEHISKDPMLKEIVKLRRSTNKHLKAKLKI
jgi:hypothetical protein